MDTAYLILALLVLLLLVDAWAINSVLRSDSLPVASSAGRC